MRIIKTYYSSISLFELRTEYFRSFPVVTPCEAFASLFLYAAFGYRQKNRSNTLSSVVVNNFIDNPG
jgi:hypothetical protein